MQTQQWLETLVACDTTSRLSNLALIETVRDYLQYQGVHSALIFNADKSKANLLATLPATAGAALGSVDGGIILSGHTDVVPVDGQKWESDPFTLTQKGTRLYGRGSCDMKGFIAAALALVPEFLTMPRTKPIHLALSYDEEVGCLGAPSLLKTLKEKGITAEGCIVGEPTDMHIVVAHKGINVFQCEVHGHAAHSSLTPQGCNAIEYAARLICAIRDIADKLKNEGPYDTLYDVPFTTMSTNTIQGGAAMNIVPELCRFSYEFRNLPGVTPDVIQSQIQRYIDTELLPKMRQELPEAQINIASIAAVPTLDAAEKDAMVMLMQALSKESNIKKATFVTEAGLFQEVGVPTIVCGPGSITQAHKPNEFIEIAQLDKCETFLRKLGQSLSV